MSFFLICLLMKIDDDSIALSLLLKRTQGTGPFILGKITGCVYHSLPWFWVRNKANQCKEDTRSPLVDNAMGLVKALFKYIWMFVRE